MYWMTKSGSVKSEEKPATLVKVAMFMKNEMKKRKRADSRMLWRS
jgi:hypothetical protein